MPSDSKPLQTSGSQLKEMLAKMGRPLKPDDRFEKLELLELLVEVINYYLRGAGKVALTLPELNAFLGREAMSEAPDYKEALSKIIQICLQQRHRLGEYVGPRNTAMLDSLLALVVMEDPKDEAGELAITPIPKRRRVESNTEGVGMLEDVAAKDTLLADLKRLVPLQVVLAIGNVGDDSSEATAKRKAEAQKEVDRILEADRTGQQILVGGNAEERRVAFRNIVLLLHPDLAFVSADDARAIEALNVSLKAFVQSEIGSAK